MRAEDRGVAEWLPIAVAAVAASMVALRAAIGPFQPLHSPLPMESVFWIAIFALLVLQPKNSGIAPLPGTEGSRFPAIRLALLLCAIALAFAGNLADPFLSDDYILVNRPPIEAAAFRVSLHTAGGDGGFRPLGNLYFDMVRSWARLDPLRWHLAGLAIHIVNCALVFSIAWNLWRNATTALITGLFFGLHGTRPEVVTWTAGAFDLLACFCVLLSVGLMVSERTRNRPLTSVVSLSLIAAGILCKESAYAAPAVAFGVLSSRLADRKIRSYLIGSGAVCVALFGYRWFLFRGPGGYIDPATGVPQIMSVHLATGAKAVLVRIWAVLFFPVNWESAMQVWMAPAIAGTAAGFLLLAASVRNSRIGSWTMYSLVAATCLAVLPAIHLALIGDSASGSRVLYLASVTFALLIGRLALLPGMRRAVAALLLLPASAAILEHNLGAWHRVALEARSLCRSLARDPSQGAGDAAPGMAEGVFFFRNGLSECIANERSVVHSK